jgi:hypothetical protein
MSALRIAKLFVQAIAVSALAALILALLPDFEPDIKSFDQRFLLFCLCYTMPICVAQVSVFLVVRWLTRR